MYNRILKRPMFRRGGPSYQSQGTGITSPYDVPRGGYYGGGTIGGGMIHGNPMGNRTGFKAPLPKDYKEPKTKTQIREEMQTVFETPKGQWLDDVIGSFGAYSTPYKDDGTAKTIGEMGAEQAEGLKAIRKERKDKQDLAKLTSLEGELKDIETEEGRAFDIEKLNLTQEGTMALAKYQGGIQIQVAELAKQNTATGQRLIANDERLAEKLEIIGQMTNPSERAAAEKAAKAVHAQEKDNIIKGSNIMDQALKIAAAMGGDPMKSSTDIITDVIVIIKGIQKQLQYKGATGGRVGYQMGTPQTGAMPVQQASLTETIDTPTADITETETVTEGQQSSVQMPYQEFRAALPAEVSDEIVQLIYYNQDAFADFAQISTQADVYAFNNKYGVSLVLPMDTETT